MKCPNCGKEIRDESKFCDACGTKIEESILEDVFNQEATSQPSPEPQQKSVSPKKKGNWKLIGGVVAAIVAAIGIGYGVANYTPTIKLADYTTVEVSGYNGLGKASISIDWEAIEAKYGNNIKYSKDASSELGAFGISESALSALGGDAMNMLEMSVNAKADKTTSLSNDDIVTVEYSKGSSIEKYITCNVDTTSLKYKVSGLEKAETFDAFANLKVEYSGVSGKASLSYNYEGDEDLSFSCDKYGQYVSNGDEITFTIDIDDTNDFVKKYGHLPEEMSKTYTVEGLTEYCDSVDAIPQAAKNEMRAQADDEMVAEVADARKYNSNATISDATYVGDYMLTIKTSAKDSWFYGDNNIYGMVYKVTYNGEAQYLGVEFDNISANDAGEYEIEDVNYPDVHGSVNGFLNKKTLDEYKNDYVDDHADSYTIHWSIQE